MFKRTAPLNNRFLISVYVLKLLELNLKKDYRKVVERSVLEFLLIRNQYVESYTVTRQQIENSVMSYQIIQK